MKTLQSLYGQSLGFHFLIFYLNPEGDSFDFISEEINSQILGPKYDGYLDPLWTLWTGNTINCEVCLI